MKNTKRISHLKITFVGGDIATLEVTEKDVSLEQIKEVADMYIKNVGKEAVEVKVVYGEVEEPVKKVERLRKIEQETKSAANELVRKLEGLKKEEAELEEKMAQLEKENEQLKAELEDEEVTKIEEEIEMENTNTEVNEERNKLFDRFDELVEEGTRMIKEKAPKGYLKLIKSNDSDIYDEFLDALCSASSGFRIAGRDDEGNKAEDIYDELLDAVYDEEDPAIQDKLKAYVTFVFRKTVALLKGTGLFAFDTTTILGVMVARVAYGTAREVVLASKAIAKAFRDDIYTPVKNA